MGERLYWSAVAFVCARNDAGRDAAAEAREVGHGEVAEWLEALMGRLDPEGRRADEEWVRKAWREAVRAHWYLEGEEDGDGGDVHDDDE
jgi:hypothetical protein